MTGGQLGFCFDQMAEEVRTAHVPSTIDTAIPYFRGLIDKHHAAMLAGDVDAVMAVRKEAEDLAVKLNGGELLGIDGGEGSPVDLLEKRPTLHRDRYRSGASAAATSPGKNGRPAWMPTPPSSGSSTDISMPYMCCGGTVATTVKCVPTAACSIARLPALLA